MAVRSFFRRWLDQRRKDFGVVWHWWVVVGIDGVGKILDDLVDAFCHFWSVDFPAKRFFHPFESVHLRLKLIEIKKDKIGPRRRR